MARTRYAARITIPAKEAVERAGGHIQDTRRIGSDGYTYGNIAITGDAVVPGLTVAQIGLKYSTLTGYRLSIEPPFPGEYRSDPVTHI